MMSYPRNLELEILENLDNPRALFILGSRRVGKTTLLHRIENQIKDKKTLFFDLENLDAIKLFKSGYSNFIQWFQAQGFPSNERVFIFLDEIQYLDEFSNFVKLIVDHHSHQIKLILSGSSAAQIKYKFRDSLVGRKFIYQLHPLTFKEFMVFKQEERIAELLGNTHKTAQIDLLVHFHEKLKNYYKDFMIYGGYPEVVLANNEKEKQAVLHENIRSYIFKDIQYLFQIERLDAFNQLIILCAIQTGALFNTNSISKTLKIDLRTLKKYLQVLYDTYFATEVRPCFSNKKKEIKKMPKVYLNDTGIRNALVKNFHPIDERSDIGALFENSIFCALNKKLEVLDTLYFWRTNDGKEVDFVLQRGIEYIPFEVKVKRTAVNHLKFFNNLYPCSELNLVRMKIEGKQVPPEINIIPPWVL